VVVLAVGSDRVSGVIRRRRSRDEAYNQIIHLMERAQGADDWDIDSHVLGKVGGHLRG